MVGMNVKNEAILPEMHIKRLQKYLQKAYGQFRNGEDDEGFDSLLKGLNELEKTVKSDRNTQTHKIEISQLLKIMKKLYFFIENKDVTGVTDLLEYQCYPLTEKWLKGCDDI